MTPFDRPALMWVTDRMRSDAPLPELVSGAVAGGVDLIQVRERGLDRLPLELLVRAIDSVAAPDAEVVVNSEIELARKLGVGVHLPEAGRSIDEARELLGPEALIGRSVHTPDAAATSQGASYLIAGHVFETRTKEGRPPIGIEKFAEIVSVAPAPVLAIGGIAPESVSVLMAAGAAGVAVMSPLTHSKTIGQSARDYRAALENSMKRPDTETIQATINGKPVELAPGTTVSALLAGRELHERLVVVERNGEIVKRSNFAEVIIEEGDLLEIVHFVGGG